ncbi:MAG: hypothetical protein EPO28_07400 [Saprospiraceae bacterium]|nr:MAG: hypothetical protein EPO28_07400 [Saprospiraceae bacterium]
MTVKGVVTGSYLTVLDISGRVLGTFNPVEEDFNQFSINLSGFSAGVYILSMKIPEQEEPIKIRFVKL